MPAEGADFVAQSPARSEPRLPQQLQQLARCLFQFGEDRLDLLRWEVAHEGDRLGTVLVRGFCAALLCFFTAEALAMLLIGIFWDTAWRLQVIAAVLGAAVLATVLTIRSYLAKRAEPSALLHHDRPLEP